jgi:hypothetical protein
MNASQVLIAGVNLKLLQSGFLTMQLQFLLEVSYRVEHLTVDLFSEV